MLLSSCLAQINTNLDANKPLIPTYKQGIKSARQILANHFEQKEEIRLLVRHLADFMDQLLIQLWQNQMQESQQMSLIAVGGYGRQELHPFSDIDLLFLLEKEPNPAEVEALQGFITLLWDIGLDVGQSVRTLAECKTESAKDITVITTLMEARLLDGNNAFFKRLKEIAFAEDIWTSHTFFKGKMTEQTARHQRFGDSAYNLEPNIKENPGGLRDIQMIGWVVKRHFGADRIRDLIKVGFLTETEYQTLAQGRDDLWRIRFALHILANKREDRLTFEYQRKLAKQFGYQSDEKNQAVEYLMQAYYRTVKSLNRLNVILLQHFSETLLDQNKNAIPCLINRRFQMTKGYLEVRNKQTFIRYPLALLEIFLLLQQDKHIKGLRASTIRLLLAHLHLIDPQFRHSIQAKSLFMEILRQPYGVAKSLKKMNRYGILERYIPDFKHIVGRMQYDLFHIYTVDEHTLVLVRNLEQFTQKLALASFPLAHRVSQSIPKLELLYLAGLFHDIGKGRGGSHADIGEKMALTFCEAHQFSLYDTNLVRWLVKNHLLMSHVAQRQDIGDPEIIQAFAEQVADITRLNYLYLLTVADICATNPKRWTAWVSSLMSALYNNTKQALQRGLTNPQPQNELIQLKQSEAKKALIGQGFDNQQINLLWMRFSVDYFLHTMPDEIIWQSQTILQPKQQRPIVKIRSNQSRQCSEIFICSADARHLFATISTILANLALNILNAQIETISEDCATNNFMVLNQEGKMIEDENQLVQIQQQIINGLKAPETVKIKPSRLAVNQEKNFQSPTKIHFQQDEANQRTILYLTTTNKTGLLAMIGRAFAELSIQLISAKISSIGNKAENTFYITDSENRPIFEKTVLDKIAETIKNNIT